VAFDRALSCGDVDFELCTELVARLIEWDDRPRAIEWARAAASRSRR
jgi:hypothetical protein